jgi:hypothetical protein
MFITSQNKHKIMPSRIKLVSYDDDDVSNNISSGLLVFNWIQIEKSFQICFDKSFLVSKKVSNFYFNINYYRNKH